jgi:hypothetical protein
VSENRLDDRGSIPAKAKDFYSSLCVQTSSEVYPASCTMCTEDVRFQVLTAASMMFRVVFRDIKQGFEAVSNT